MKTFPAAFAAEKNRKTGAFPFWILECPFSDTGTIYLSDVGVTFTVWKGGITTKSWVKDWGRIVEDISEEMGLTKVSSFTMDLIIDPHASPDIKTVLETPANNAETTDCVLYLAFYGLLGAGETTDPPQAIWRGNFTDWEKMDELVLRCRMDDVSVRLDRYVGTRLNAADYPDAHPDDIGKVMPIVYGANNRVRALRAAWGLRTTLTAGISASDTALTLTDVAGLGSTGSLWIDDERVYFGARSGNTLSSLTRGANGTPAQSHVSGAQVWEHLASYDSIAAGHPLKAVTAVYARIDSYDLMVTEGITHEVVNGVHLIRSESRIRVAPAENLSLIDPGHSHAEGAPTTRTGSSATESLSAFTRTGDLANVVDGNPGSSCVIACLTDNQVVATVTAHFPAWTGGPVTGVYAKIRHRSKKDLWAPAVAGLTCNGVSLACDDQERTETIDLGATTVPTAITITWGHWVGDGYYNLRTTLYEIQMIVAGVATTSTSTGLALTGGITYTRNVEYFTALADGYADDSSGTITGTPGALIERPDHVVKHLLFTCAAWPVSQFFSNGAAVFDFAYKFSAVLQDYRRLKEWLAQMAWEGRSWFRFAATRAELLVRPDTLASDKTVTAAMTAMDPQSFKTLTRERRSRLEEVINRISCHYNRDATKSGDDAYRGLYETSDPASIARYGEKEHPGKFRFDFIQSPAMAEAVAGFYLSRYKDRKKVIEAVLFLDNVELEFADGVTFSEAGNLLCETEQVNISPGSGRDMRNDKIQLIAREY